MKTVPIEIAGETGGHKSVRFNAEKTQNMYLDISSKDGRKGIHDFPGLKAWDAASVAADGGDGDAYGDYIKANIVPRLWIRGASGIINEGSAGTIVPNTYAVGYAVANGENPFKEAFGTAIALVGRWNYTEVDTATDTQSTKMTQATDAPQYLNFSTNSTNLYSPFGSVEYDTTKGLLAMKVGYKITHSESGNVWEIVAVNDFTASSPPYVQFEVPAGVGIASETGVGVFTFTHPLGPGGSINPSAGGVGFMTATKANWTIQVAGNKEAFTEQADGAIEVRLEGDSPPASSAGPQVILDFGMILGWQVSWLVSGNEGSYIPAPNSPPRATPLDTLLTEVVSSGTGVIDDTTWGFSGGTYLDYGLNTTGIYTQGTASGSGHTGTLRMNVWQLDAYDEILDPSPYDDSVRLNTHTTVRVNGHAGFNWWWPELTFVNDSDYSLAFKHVQQSIYGRIPLVLTADQIIYAAKAAGSTGILVGFAGDDLVVTHGATANTFTGVVGGDHVIVYDKAAQTLKLYTDGVLITTKTTVTAPPAGTNTFESIGNNGGVSTGNFFPVNMELAELLHIDRVVTPAEVAALYAAGPS